MPELPPMTPVTSSHIASVGYDADSRALYIEFSNGALWRYDGVPPFTASGLAQAGSAGQYFHANIKNSYPATRVN